MAHRGKNVSFDAQTYMNDVPLKKKNISENKLEEKRVRGNLRMQMFNRQKGEEELSKGMSIRNIFLQEQGLLVRQDEDKNEINAFDAYDHAKKVKNEEMSYPSGPPSFAGHSISSNHPVRGIMRKRTRKTINQVISVLEQEVRNEANRKEVDRLFNKLYSLNNRATRRTKAVMQKSTGKMFQPVVHREEKVSTAITFKYRASHRAKTVMHNSLACYTPRL